MALFGGDTYVAERPDLGWVMKFVKDTYNPVVVAVQCWEEYDTHVDYVWKYPEVKDNGHTVYGGFDAEGNGVGGTAVYLGEDVRKLLTVVFDVDARGRVGAREKEFALLKGLEVVQIEAQAKYL